MKTREREKSINSRKEEREKEAYYGGILESILKTTTNDNDDGEKRVCKTKISA